MYKKIPLSIIPRLSVGEWLNLMEKGKFCMNKICINVCKYC